MVLPIVDFRLPIATATRDGDPVPSGNRDPETGITPMDNFVCWRCGRETPGAFMLMRKAGEKWLVERQHQMELAGR